MTATDRERDWVCLSLLPGLGPSTIFKLVEHFGDAGAVLNAEDRLRMEVPGVQAGRLRGFAELEKYGRLAQELIDSTRAAGGKILTPDQDEFPRLLKEIHDPPAVLYGCGNFGLLDQPSVAMVGSRSATTYGRRVAFSFARSLSEQGVTVVSGLALGIDSEAHAGALRGVGSTVAVLGCGLDIVYPRQNRKLYEQIAEHGLILSEYPLGTKPEGYRFPARNRIIAGISEGVVVVEAARKSGSLITAQMALDCGREIFAVPGQVDSCKSEGTHWLLQHGAQLVANADDILAELHCSTLAGPGKIVPREEKKLTGIDPDALALLRHIEPYAMSRDEIATKADILPSRLSELLLFLELEGRVEILPGDLVRCITLD